MKTLLLLAAPTSSFVHRTILTKSNTFHQHLDINNVAINNWKTQVNQFTAAMSTSAQNSEKALVVDPFAHRQFSEKESSTSYGGTVL